MSREVQAEAAFVGRRRLLVDRAKAQFYLALAGQARMLREKSRLAGTGGGDQWGE